jgi:hypothetical protein
LPSLLAAFSDRLLNTANDATQVGPGPTSENSVVAKFAF